ncbi:hypothetical protein ACHAWF_000153, partial [Thalassiosira exigua]
MIVPVGAPANGSSGIVEWVMIELNGELLKPLDEPRAAPGAVGRQVELGSVKFDADGSPTMIIGNHELRGKANKLKEPFAVLR